MKSTVSNAYEWYSKGLDASNRKEYETAVEFFRKSIELGLYEFIAVKRLAFYYRYVQDYGSEIQLLNNALNNLYSSEDKSIDEAKTYYTRKLEIAIKNCPPDLLAIIEPSKSIQYSREAEE